MIIFRKLIVPVVGVAVLVLVPAATAAKTYRGFIANQNGKAQRTVKAGDFHGLDFRERAGGKLRYRVCISGGAVHMRHCFTRTTGSSGRSDINVSLYFNDPDLGGPGNWKARWSVNGRTVAHWSFKVTSQGFAEGS